MLDVLAPIFERVIAIDRSPVQLERAAERIVARVPERGAGGGRAGRHPGAPPNRRAADLVFSARCCTMQDPRQTCTR